MEEEEGRVKKWGERVGGLSVCVMRPRKMSVTYCRKNDKASTGICCIF